MNPTPRVVITGGAGTLGAAIADCFFDGGWSVDAPGRETLEVSRMESVSSYFAGRETDLLICNAGITRDAPIARHPSAAWDEVWQVNFQGARNCVRAALPTMKFRQTGHIILISSHSAIHPPFGQAAYATAKAALIGLMDDLSADAGTNGVRINAILPGFLETRMTAGLTPQRVDEIRSAHTLGRFNTCEAVAVFIRFLHENLPHTSGQVFQLDSRPR